MQPVSTPAGEVKNQPIGDACYECFDLWRRCWKPEFASFEMMCEKYMSDKPTRARIELSRLGLRDSSSKPRVIEQASTMTGYKLTVDRRYWLLTDRDLRCLLGVARLTKRHTNGLISTTIPAEDDPSLSETAYFFKDPARKFRTATLSMYYESGATTQEMPAADHTWEGQAISVLRATTAQHAQLGSSTILAEKEKTSYIPTLSVFLERHGISLASAAGSGMLPPVVSIGSADGSAAGDDESDEDPDGQEVIGIVASRYVAAEASATTTPQKHRPKVPDFCTADAASSGPASPTGASEASFGGIRRLPSSSHSETTGEVSADGTTEVESEFGDDANDAGCGSKTRGRYLYGPTPLPLPTLETLVGRPLDAAQF